jgi:formylglycine-generating enzyme required for sulfatase activity
MKFRRIPEGQFERGSPADEMSRQADETLHRVKISYPFYMDAREVRQREFYKLMMPKDYNYAGWKLSRGPIQDGADFVYRWHTGGVQNKDDAFSDKPLTDTFPMTPVTWDRAREFCRRLTKREKDAGRLPEGYVYRLPTEAEWEYSCRAGTRTPYNFDPPYDDEEHFESHVELGAQSHFYLKPEDTNSDRKPNAWGLYDMHGNAWEWCLDMYAPYASGPQQDPVHLGEGEIHEGEASAIRDVGPSRVVRGGGVVLDSKPEGGGDLHPFIGGYSRAVHPFARSAARDLMPPDTDLLLNLGIRAVLAPKITLPQER